MNGCARLESGAVELYFYGELDAAERASMAEHVASCAECRVGLEELQVIQAALSTRPAVTAPPGEDWTTFMARLDDAVAAERRVQSASAAQTGFSSARLVASEPIDIGDRRVSRQPRGFRPAPYLAMAALLALATMSVAYIARSGRDRGRSSSTIAEMTPSRSTPAAVPASASEPSGAALRHDAEAAFAALSEQHFERSKLVVLGLASKDPRRARREDWAYERQLASSLLTDTRLYRLAAEERGLTRIADVMGDLELVLLQTSLAAPSGRQDLEQIQRLIDKRDLVTKMELVAGI